MVQPPCTRLFQPGLGSGPPGCRPMVWVPQSLFSVLQTPLLLASTLGLSETQLCPQPSCSLSLDHLPP